MRDTDALEKAREKASIKKPIENNNVPKNLRIGDAVKVLSMNMRGTVHSLPNDKGELQVQMGIMKSNVNIKDLVLIEERDELAEKYGYANRKVKNNKKKNANGNCSNR